MFRENESSILLHTHCKDERSFTRKQQRSSHRPWHHAHIANSSSHYSCNHVDFMGHKLSSGQSTFPSQSLARRQRSLFQSSLYVSEGYCSGVWEQFFITDRTFLLTPPPVFMVSSRTTAHTSTSPHSAPGRWFATNRGNQCNVGLESRRQ
jgi:hypothetical protein